MVLKLYKFSTVLSLEFESDVISDGTQTVFADSQTAELFESDVISDGTQTPVCFAAIKMLFESDVISDGTQTLHLRYFL